MSLNGLGISPIKQSQEEITDTLFCLNVPYSIEYGKTKTGVKTRIVKTQFDSIEIYFYDKMKLNGKVKSGTEVKHYLIEKHI